MPDTTTDYLAHRLDGARDLYLLALAVGERGPRPPARPFGALIQEARLHFIMVIEEARVAGFDTRDIQSILSRHTSDLADAIRADMRDALEALLREHTNPR